MSMDPDSLMIFKGREDDDPTPKKHLKGSKESEIYALPGEFDGPQYELELVSGQQKTETPQVAPASIYSAEEPKQPEEEEPAPHKAPGRAPIYKPKLAQAAPATTPDDKTHTV
jgi:hypothetical protein